MIEITNYKFDFYYGKEAEQFSFFNRQRKFLLP